MDDLLRARYRQASARWPNVELDAEAFAGHVRARAGEGDGDLEQLNTDDLYLALACARSDPSAIAHFERTVMARVSQVLRPLDTRDEFAEEVKQRLRDRLLLSTETQEPKLVEFAGRGPLEAWVNVSAIRTGLNVLRSERRRAKHVEPDWSRALVAADTGDPELEAFKAKHRAQFEQALADACGELDDRSRAVLRLHFLDGLSIDRIGLVYNVHRSTAARWITRAREQLHAAARESLVRDHGIAPSQASFVERLVLSQLAVSFSQLLAEAPDE